MRRGTADPVKRGFARSQLVKFTTAALSKQKKVGDIASLKGLFPGNLEMAIKGGNQREI